jgi:hypothetical protein
MSIHRLALHEDPFTVPATLSVEEASHFIQRRVSACGGDGAVLFPPETCAEIHQHARGLPDAICDLAGRAMRTAAAAGAPAVLPTHVRVAAGMAGDHDARKGDAAPSSVGASTSGAAPNSDPAAGAPAITADSTAGTPAAAADLAIDDVPDLPPFIDSGIALPSMPSESLAPDARAWVSRFMPAELPDPPRGASSWIADPPTIHDATSASPPSPVLARGASPPAPAPSSPGPGTRRRRPRRRWEAATGGIAATAVIVCLVLVVGRQYPRTNLPPAGPEARHIAPASVATIGRTSLVPEPSGGAHLRSTAAASPPTAPASLVAALPPRAVPPSASARSAPAALSVVQADSSRPRAPTPRFGLEVASFIVEDRALAERERLAAAGHRVRLTTEWEGGSAVYRVVLGSFASPAAAERAADGLLSAGTIQQARVVPLSRRE